MHSCKQAVCSSKYSTMWNWRCSRELSHCSTMRNWRCSRELSHCSTMWKWRSRELSHCSAMWKWRCSRELSHCSTMWKWRCGWELRHCSTMWNYYYWSWSNRNQDLSTFYLLRHSSDKIFQPYFSFSKLQVMESSAKPGNEATETTVFPILIILATCCMKIN